MPGPSRSFLLVCHDAGGTVPPIIAVAEALVARGHEVAVLAQPSVRARAERAGSRFIAFAELDDYARDVALEEQLERTLPAIAGPAVGNDVLAAADQVRADAVVVDANLSGALAAAEALDRPSAVLLHSMYRTFVDVWFGELWPLLADGINETRAAFGVEPVDGWPALFARHDLLLSVVPRSFDAPVAETPETLTHHGFLVPRPPGADAGTAFPDGDGPAVLVGLSTTYQGQEALLESIVHVLAEVGARAVVTTGGHVPGAGLHAPAGISVVEHASHAALLPQADLMLTHAGLGSVAAALDAGVPLVCTPIARDQPLNTERVEALGVGLGCTTSHPADIAAAVAEVLGDPGFGERAAGLAAESRAAGGAAAVAEELERRVGAG